MEYGRMKSKTRLALRDAVVDRRTLAEGGRIRRQYEIFRGGIRHLHASFGGELRGIFYHEICAPVRTITSS